MDNRKNSILVVDDEVMAVEMFEDSFCDFYDIYTATSATQALQILQNHPVDMVISDQRMPEMTGIELLSEIKMNYPETLRVLLTGYSSIDDAIKAINGGVLHRYICKPWEEDYLLNEVKVLFREYELEAQNKRLNQKLMESMTRYQGLVESLSDAVLSVSRDGTINMLNGSTLAIFGYENEKELIGKHISCLISDLWAELHLFNSLEEAEHFVVTNKETEAFRKCGEKFPILISIVSYQFGGSCQYSVVIRDITELYEKEKMLVKAKEDAEEANAAKSILLSNTTHELKTPLHCIINFAQLGKEAADIVESNDCCRQIENNASSLLSIVENLLDLTYFEAGGLQLNLEKGFLSECVEKTVHEMAVMAQIYNVELEFSKLPDEADVVYDVLRMRQVMRNLIGNALKFSPAGKVVRVRMSHSDCCSLLEVIDQGPGVPEDELVKIFDKFYQSTRTRNSVAGTGVGLAVSREIVEAHGGKISVANTSEGTVFTVELSPTTLPDQVEMPAIII